MEYISKTTKSFFYCSELCVLGIKLDKRYNSHLLKLVEKPEHLVHDKLGFRKDFPLAPTFAHHIWRVREAGVIERVRRKYLAPVLASDSKYDQWSPLSLNTLVTPFLFFCAASVVCSVLCLLEIACAALHMHTSAYVL